WPGSAHYHVGLAWLDLYNSVGARRNAITARTRIYHQRTVDWGFRLPRDAGSHYPERVFNHDYQPGDHDWRPDLARIGAELPGRGHPAADANVGQHAERRAVIFQGRDTPGRVSRPAYCHHGAVPVRDR